MVHTEEAVSVAHIGCEVWRPLQYSIHNFGGGVRTEGRGAREQVNPVLR